MPELAAPEGSDFSVETDASEDAARKLLAAMRDRVPARDVQVLCPVNRGSLGVCTLNIVLQQVLNPTGPSGWSGSAGRSVLATG